MRPLAAADMLKVWEQGAGQSALDRALTMLSAACPDLSLSELASWNIAQRDAQLFELRKLTLGSQIDGCTTCPQCQERLEWSFDLTTLGWQPSARSTDEELEFEAEDCALRFRLPNSLDLAAVAVCEDVAVARRLLAERCVLQTSHDGAVITEMSDDAVTKLAERIGAYAPEAEVRLDFACPSCGDQWQALFDIAGFFWAEIAAQARLLLREVHLLARFYGWREADILAMSARRRQAYLEMIG